MKISKRLEAIASLINSDDKVLDVGCDHAYLDIYLALNKKNKTIIASDISSKVIESAKQNINQYNLNNKIKVYCTNGTKNIKEKYDTIVIAGMGYHTIIDILNNTPKVKKMIICSNNHWEDTRKSICKIGYDLKQENLVLEKNKLYSIMLFESGKSNLSFKEIMVGKYNYENKKQYKIYLKQINNIYKKIPLLKFSKKLKYKLIIIYLKTYLRKKAR